MGKRLFAEVALLQLHGWNAGGRCVMEAKSMFERWRTPCSVRRSGSAIFGAAWLKLQINGGELMRIQGFMLEVEGKSPRLRLLSHDDI